MRIDLNLYLFLTVLMLASCSVNSKEQVTTESIAMSPNDDEWITLFDGSTTDGWRIFNGADLPANWVIEDGSLKSLGTGDDVGGDIIYGEREFTNFELKFDWKISEGGNSGVFYHVVEGDKYEAPYQNAPEYQVLDDIGFPEPIEDWQKVGADYAMYTIDSDKKRVKPAGEWNTSKIYFTEEKAEHWLNGEKLFEFVPWSEDWNSRKNNGKWKDYPDYGIAKSGFIGIQDHGSFIWYRNILIREL